MTRHAATRSSSPRTSTSTASLPGKPPRDTCASSSASRCSPGSWTPTPTPAAPLAWRSAAKRSTPDSGKRSRHTPASGPGTSTAPPRPPWTPSWPGSAETGGPVLGAPTAGTRLYVLDGKLQHSLPGAAGELYIAGSQLARGYRGRPELTAERFVADPFAGGGQRMYRTGDVVYRHADGRLVFAGRNDDQLKIRGFRVEPGEVEKALRRCPRRPRGRGARRRAATARTRLIGYVVPAGNRRPGGLRFTRRRAARQRAFRRRPSPRPGHAAGLHGAGRRRRHRRSAADPARQGGPQRAAGPRQRGPQRRAGAPDPAGADRGGDLRRSPLPANRRRGRIVLRTRRPLLPGPAAHRQGERGARDLAPGAVPVPRTHRGGAAAGSVQGRGGKRRGQPAADPALADGREQGPALRRAPGLRDLLGLCLHAGPAGPGTSADRAADARDGARPDPPGRGRQA